MLIECGFLLHRELVNIGSEIVSDAIELVDDGSAAEEQPEEVVAVRELGKVEKLSPEQVALCQYRHMLLCYLDRLDTYEVSAISYNIGDFHAEKSFVNFRLLKNISY